MSDVMGWEGKVYKAAAALAAIDDAPDATWTECPIVTDVTLPEGATEIDVTDKSSNGFKLSDVSLLETGADFTIPDRSSNAIYQAIRTAYRTRGVITLAFADGDITVANTDVFAANFKVTKFELAQPINGRQVRNVSVRPNSFPQYFQAAGA